MGEEENIIQGSQRWNPNTKQWEYIDPDQATGVSEEVEHTNRLNARIDPTSGQEIKRDQTQPVATPATPATPGTAPAATAATPAATATQAPGKLQTTINTGKINAPEGTQVHNASYNNSGAFRGYRDAGAAEQKYRELYNSVMQNGPARAILERYTPTPDPEDPEAEQKQLQRRKTAVLLADMLRTIMGGVAAENNASMPGVDSVSAVKGLDARSQQLHDAYVSQLAAKRKRDDEFYKKYYDALGKDREAAQKYAEQGIKLYKEDSSFRNGEAVGYDEDGNAVDANGRRVRSGRGGGKAAATHGLTIAGIPYTTLTKEAKDDFLETATQYALKQPPDSRVYKQLHTLYEEYVANAGKSIQEARKPDRYGRPQDTTSTATQVMSYDDWLKNSKRAQVYIRDIIETNPDDIIGLGDEIDQKLVKWGIVDKNFKAKRYNVMNPGGGQPNPDPQGGQQRKVGQPFDNNGKMCYIDNTGKVIEIKEGMSYNNNGISWTAKKGKNGKIVLI